MDSVIVIDKPGGMTSHDVVEKLRKLFQIRRVGHVGTLDPMATGVLPVCLGKATRLAEYLQAGQKEYVAGLRLGTVTDTQDITGKVIQEVAIDWSTEEIKSRFRKIIGHFTGEIDQIPPMFSALKRKGRPLYELAREGKEVDRESRSIRIESIQIESIRPPEVQFRVVCSTGTYVRTLCHDMGALLGPGGCLSALRRTRSGHFEESHAIPLAELRRENSKSFCLTPAEALRHLPSLTADATMCDQLRHGQRIEAQAAPVGQVIVVLTQEGTLAAVGRQQETCIQPEKVFL